MGFRRALVDLDDEPVRTVPIVFHVVHAGGETNVSDEQVLSQVDALQATFRTQATDTKIEFCLAVRDPDGNPTNGITRTNGAAIWPEYATAGISNGTQGGVGVDHALEARHGDQHAKKKREFCRLRDIGLDVVRHLVRIYTCCVVIQHHVERVLARPLHVHLVRVRGQRVIIGHQ